MFSKKNHFKQHKPGWADDIRVNFDFSTQDELLSHEVLQQWTKFPEFCRFSISKSDSEYCCHAIMAELKEGREWWVLGYIEHLNGITLPEWTPVRD